MNVCEYEMSTLFPGPLFGLLPIGQFELMPKLSSTVILLSNRIDGLKVDFLIHSFSHSFNPLKGEY